MAPTPTQSTPSRKSEPKNTLARKNFGICGEPWRRLNDHRNIRHKTKESRMSVVSGEISVALARLIGEAAPFLIERAGHSTTLECSGGGLVVIENVCADAVRLSRHVDGNETFACYVQFAGKENPKTLEWTSAPGTIVRGVFSPEGQPVSSSQIDALRDAVGLPAARKLAA
jgi:hypothetical protein